MNISISKTHIIGIVLLVAMGVMMFGSGAWGRTAAVTTGGLETCTLRADLTNGEVNNLAPNYPGSGDIDSGIELNTIDSDGNAVSGSGTLCAYSSIKYIASLLRLVVIVIAGVMFVLAGFLYATSQGDTEKQSKAKNILVTGVIGVFIALVATIFPSIAASFM